MIGHIPNVALAKCRVAANSEPVRLLSLNDHSADVAGVFRRILDQPTIAARLATLASVREIPPVVRDRLAAVVALHDLGKATRGFQVRIRRAAGLSVPMGVDAAGHVAPAVGILFEPLQGIGEKMHAALLAASGLDRMLGWFGGGNGLLNVMSAILAHHGSLPAPSQGDRRPEPWENHPALPDPVAEAARLGAAIRRWFPAAFGEDAPGLPPTDRFLFALAGLTVWADWLGSDETLFPLDPPGAPGTGAGRFDPDRADEAVRRRFVPAAPRTALAASAPVTLARAFPHLGGLSPQPMQAAALSLPVDVNGLPPGSLLVLEAETGSGKTEAATLLFLRLLAAGRVDGLWFALPTRVSATQIHARLVRAIGAALGDGVPVGLGVPGLLRVDEAEGIRLPDRSIAWPDDARADAADRGWAVAHGARYLAGPIMAGTVDQLLAASLKMKFAPFRAAAMLRQLLVVDEVHASDPYMRRLLSRALNQHRAAGGIALVMSATLGAVARTRLARPGSEPPDPTTAVTVPYPAIHLAAPGQEPVPVASAPMPEGAGKTITLDLRTDPDDTTLAEELVAAAADGARVLVIRNTVARAQAMQAAVEAAAEAIGRPDLLFRCAGTAAPHHARFAAEDRRRLDMALEARLGRDGPAVGGVVAVGTQTVEIAIDCDADLMATDLCPADVLLQRLGRLHRHRARDGVRPAGVREPRAIVAAPDVARLAALIGKDGSVTRNREGWGFVYADLVSLVATRHEIERRGLFVIPQDNRALVEAVTHPTALDALAGAMGAPWPVHRTHVEGRSAQQAQAAKLVALDWTKWDGNLLSDGVSDVATRLGLNDRLVSLPMTVPGPFGEPVRSFALPDRWLAGIDPESPVEDVLAEAGVVRFRVGTAGFLYDRSGVRPA
jgi:CRISPR-associated endonuclease/helicase Cas3